MDWTSASPCVGVTKTALATYDEVVQRALQSNLKVLGLLSNESWQGGQSAWTANNAENTDGNGDNAYIDAFAQSAAGILASHFGAQVSQWEVWNEPNAWRSNPSPGVFSGGSFMYPSNFAWLLKQSYQAIKAANPAALVISGGIFSHDLSTGADYLDSTYAMGIQNAFWFTDGVPIDAVGQHLYIDQAGPTSSDHIAAILQDLRNTYLAYEDPNTTKQTYVTEVGWKTNSVSPAIQAQNLSTAYTTFRATSYVAQAYWFSVQDVPEANLYYGLVDVRGVQKPAFVAYQADAT